MTLRGTILSTGVVISALACSAPAAAQQAFCNPASNATKILQSPNARNIHPEWRPPNFIGTSWSLTQIRREGAFISGRLVTPRGGVQPYRIYGILSEWQCEGLPVQRTAPQMPARTQTVAAATLPTFRDCDKCPEMVVLPAGSFMMGATKADKALSGFFPIDSELPRHRVNIGYSFAIGRYEVTVEEFDAYVKETGVRTGGDCLIRTPDFGPNRGRVIGTPKRGAERLPGLVHITDGTFDRPGAKVSRRHPATCISRREAKAYLVWLSKKTGKQYRFPTEAEWEYAVRAGTTTPFHFGGGLGDLCRYGNFADRASNYQAKVVAQCAERPSPEGTAPVGSYQPNRWGLHDMLGNAFEFIEDCFSENYVGAPSDGSPRTGPRGTDACTNFITRSYFFDSMGGGLRSAARCTAADWDGRVNGLAIRVVVSMEDGAWDRK